MKRFNLLLVFVLMCLVSFGQEKKEFKISLLLDNASVEVLPILESLQEEVKAVVGEDAVVVFNDYLSNPNNFSIDKVRANYQALLEDDTDIILAFGMLSNIILNDLQDYQKPTILFGSINSDFIAIDKDKTVSGIPNFNYLITSQSYDKDLETFKKLYNFSNVGIVIEDFFPEVVSVEEILDNEVFAGKTNYKIIPFKTKDDIINNLDGIDAVYMAGGFFLSNEEIQELSDVFLDRGLPSFTATSVMDVALGLMATNQTKDNLNRFLRRIALNVEAIVNGKNASELPVYLDYQSKLSVNYNTGRKLNLPLKYSLITNTNFVGDPNEMNANISYNLIEVINKTLNDNVGLKAEEKNIDLVAQDLKIAKSNYYPNVSASASGLYVDPKVAEISLGQSPEYKTSGNITLSQTIFSEAANAGITIQENILEAQKANFDATQLDAVLQASTIYFNTLMLKTNVRIQSENLEVTKKNLEIAEQNFDAGQSGKMDVLRLKSEEAQNTQTFVEAISQLNQSFIELNALLNNDIDTEIDVEDAFLSEGIFKKYQYRKLGDFIDSPRERKQFVAFLIQEAKSNAPELKALNYNLKATERNLKLNSSGRFLPTLALQGQYNQDFNQWGKGSTPEAPFDNNYNVGLNLSIPIFKQSQQDINKQIAEIQIDQLNDNLQNIEITIERNIGQGVLNLVNDITNIELSKVSEETAKESLELTQVSYSNGAVSITQLLDSQRNYLQAQISRANATYNYLLNSINLERYIGSFFVLKSENEIDDFVARFNQFLLSQQ